MLVICSAPFSFSTCACQHSEVLLFVTIGVGASSLDVYQVQGLGFRVYTALVVAKNCPVKALQQKIPTVNATIPGSAHPTANPQHGHVPVWVEPEPQSMHFVSYFGSPAHDKAQAVLISQPYVCYQQPARYPTSCFGVLCL